MASSYFYICTIFKDVPADDAAKTDFEANFKATAVLVSAVIITENTFIINKNYTDFKALIALPLTWAEVRYIDEVNRYELYLNTVAPL